MQENVSNSKPKMTIKKKVIIVAVCLVVLLLIGFIGWFVYSLITPSSALNTPKRMGTRTGISSTYIGTDNTKQKWFNSTLEALEDDQFFEGLQYFSDNIFEKSKGNMFLQANFYETDREGVGFVINRFDRDEELFSRTSRKSSYIYVDLEGMWSYDTEIEKAVEYIATGMFSNLTPRELIFPYAGVSTYPNVKSLTILGMSPTDIIEYEYEDITYYFWYYEFDFNTYLENHEDFDFGGFTNAQLIKILDIEVDEPGEETAEEKVSLR